jgi:hypothetical protein
MVARKTFATALFGAVATLAVAAPFWTGVSGLSSEAVAAPGGSGQGGSGRSGGNSDTGNSDKGHSGGKSGNANSDKGNSGKGDPGTGDSGKGDSRSGAGTGGKGRDGGTASDGSANGAKSDTGRPASKSDDGFGQRGNQHINSVTGTRVKINGSDVEVLHLDGIREEITDGRYRMNDAQGRLIIGRPATEGDRARFRAMIR